MLRELGFQLCFLNNQIACVCLTKHSGCPWAWPTLWIPATETHQTSIFWFKNFNVEIHSNPFLVSSLVTKPPSRQNRKIPTLYLFAKHFLETSWNTSLMAMMRPELVGRATDADLYGHPGNLLKEQIPVRSCLIWDWMANSASVIPFTKMHINCPERFLCLIRKFNCLCHVCHMSISLCQIIAVRTGLKTEESVSATSWIVPWTIWNYAISSFFFHVDESSQLIYTSKPWTNT